MKRTLLIACIGVALSGCNGSIPTLTFQQDVALVCSNAKAAVSIANDDGLFTGGAEATLTNDVQPSITKVCAPGAIVTASSLQDIANDSVPALKGLVTASGLSVQGKADANTAIDLITLAVNDAIALAPTTTVTAPAAASQ